MKTVIVTGGSSGIGKAIVQRLASDSWNVVIQYKRNQKAAEQLVSSLRHTRGELMAVYADVTHEPSVASLFDQAAQLGPVHAVVHSAGIMGLSTIMENDVELFDRVISTNLRGAFLVLAQASERVSIGGRIVALSSSVVAKSTPGYGAYIASKAGLEGLVRVLAQEVRGRGINVNSIAPGPVATALLLSGKTQEQLTQLAKMAPMERLGEPEDIARVVSFLLGQDSAWVHGQVLRVNGGFV